MSKDKWLEIKEKLSYVFIVIIFVVGGGFVLYMFTPELHDSSSSAEEAQYEAEEAMDRMTP